MHESFKQAINPKPRHACLRIPLQPLTLGHLFLLHELDSPVVAQKPCGFGDVLLAVLVCAQPHADARKMLRKGWWLSVFAWYWGLRCIRLDFAEEVQKLRRYLKDEQASPPIAKPPKDQSRAIGSPWEWVLLDLLRSTYRMNESEALNTPMLRANVLWAVHNDQEGKITLETASDGIAAIIKALYRRQRETAAAGQN